MNQHLEIEYKSMIEESTAKRLLDFFPFEAPKKQINHYFDTIDKQLFKLGIMCRIREIENTYLFTLKIPQSDGVLEFEIELDSLSLDNILITEKMNEYDINTEKMLPIAKSITNRYEYSDEYGMWCLDYSEFSNHNDIEIEYELHQANEKAYQHYVDTLTDLNIIILKAKPKYIRALNSSLEPITQSR